MNGMESIHITVFPIQNTPGVICSAAEMETETGQRIHFQHWDIWFFFLNIASLPPFCQLYTSNWMVAGEYHHLLSGTYWKLFQQDNLKVMFIFHVHVFFIWSADSPRSWLWLCVDYMYELFALYKHKGSYTAASVVPLWVSHAVMIDQPLSVRVVLRNSHICAAGNKERLIMTRSIVAQIQGL